LAYVPEDKEYKLIREGVHHLTFLDGLIVKELNGSVMTKYRHLYGEDLKVSMPMRVWGEAGIVKVTGKIKSKIQNVRTRRDVCWICSEQHKLYLPNVCARAKQHSQIQRCAMAEADVI
jgi:hypothetical protein